MRAAMRLLVRGVARSLFCEPQICVEKLWLALFADEEPTSGGVRPAAE